MTAVEQLELSLLGLISFDSEELRTKYKERVAKAKEMEKQHIIEAYLDGNYDNRVARCKEEKYYNAKFKKK